MAGYSESVDNLEVDAETTGHEKGGVIGGVK
jgi:hypothetical protein